MASDTRTRASDADRDRTAAALREHLAVGRLTQDVFGERPDMALVAKTLGELDDLMADLPLIDLGQLADAQLYRAADNPPVAWRRNAGRSRPGRASPPRHGGQHGDPGSRSASAPS